MGWQQWKRRFTKLRNDPQPVRSVLARALWHSGLSPLLTIPLTDGLKLRFYPSSISAALWISANARNEDAEFLQAVLRDRDSYVDCGANIGHLAVIARHITGAAGMVEAIEANPRIFRYCVGNLELNGFRDVRVRNVALGEKLGSIRISDRRDDDQNRIGQDGAEVQMSPLDQLIAAPHLTMLKIDVEGYELQVLQGASRTLANTDVVYCELSASNSARFGSTPSQAEDLLLQEGFELAHRVGDTFQIGRERVYDRLSTAEQPSTGYNLVAVKPAFTDQFESRVRERGYRVVRV